MTGSQERDPKRGVAYLRCSTRTNSGGDTFKRQEAAVRAYAARQGIELVEVYQDVISGKSELQDRAGLSEAMERIRSNGVGVFIVEAPNRLARDSLVHHMLVRKLADLGVRVVDSTGLDLGNSNDPTAKLIGAIMAALSEFDRELTVARLRGARDRKRRETGRCEGVLGFGEDPNRPEEGEAVARMRALRRLRGGTRRSYAAVAVKLNAEAVPTRSGVAWSPAVVRKILTRKRRRSS